MNIAKRYVQWAVHQLLFAALLGIIINYVWPEESGTGYIFYAWTIIGIIGFAVTSALLIYHLDDRDYRR